MEKLKSIYEITKLILKGTDFISIPMNPSTEKEIDECIKVGEGLVTRLKSMKGGNVFRDNKGNYFVTNLSDELLNTTFTREELSKKGISGIEITDVSSLAFITK